MLTDKEELKKVGKPLKEITSIKGFKEISSLKEIFASVKDITDEKGFKELSEFKDIFAPEKPEKEVKEKVEATERMFKTEEKRDEVSDKGEDGEE